MQTLLVVCVCLGILSGTEALNALGKSTERNEVTDSDSLVTLSPETDVSSSQDPLVDSHPESGGEGTNQAQRTRHLRDTATDTTQSIMGRTEAVWVELNAVLERWGVIPGKLNTILMELKEEKKRLMDQGEEQKGKKKEEEEDEEEEDDEDEEEEEEEEEDEEEEEEEEKEEESEAANSTLTRDGFTDSLPDSCQLGGARISCKQIGLSHLPVITNLGVTILELPGNNITRIPPRGFSGLPNLEEVDLSMNILEDSSLNTSLFMNLTKLRRLNLDGNQLSTIPRLPSSLEELNINNNKINQLASHNFKGLINLQVLELTGNLLYEGSVAPWTFKPLKTLKYLRLDKNRFSSIPAGLPPSLEDLRMKENQIVEIQDRLLDKCVHLKVLDLSHNLLKENSIYPEAWVNLPKLEALDLSHNQMSVVPSHLPRALRQLSLQHNHIHAIPPYTLSHLRPGLESLRLSHNLLEEYGVLGKSFRGVYQTLVELLLDNNRFDKVPQNMRHFKNLQQLRLDHNQIRSVPVKSVCKIKRTEQSHLTAVHLEYNFIDVKNIPRTAFSCIRDPSKIILEPQTQAEGQQTLA